MTTGGYDPNDKPEGGDQGGYPPQGNPPPPPGGYPPPPGITHRRRRDHLPADIRRPPAETTRRLPGITRLRSRAGIIHPNRVEITRRRVITHRRRRVRRRVDIRRLRP